MDSDSLSVFLQSIAPAGQLLNGVAPGLGTAAQIGLTGLSDIASNKAVKDAKNLIPPTVDPELQNYMRYLDNQKRTYEQGSAYAADMREIKKQQSATQQGVVRVAGGNPGLALAGLNRAQQTAGETYGKVAAEGQQAATEYDKMYGQLLQDQSKRTLGIQALQYNQAQIDARQHQAQSAQTLMNLMSVMKPVDFKKLLTGLGGNNQQQQLLTPQALATQGQQQAILGPYTQAPQTNFTPYNFQTNTY